MLTSEQRETLRKLECNNYLCEHEEEAIDAALETIDEQAAELALLRRVATYYRGTPPCMTDIDHCCCATCRAWREWRRRFGGQQQKGVC